MNTIDAERLLLVEPDESTLRHLRDVVGGPIALLIGAEGADRLVAAMHVARTYLHSRARLVCAIESGADAVRLVRRQINELALPTAHVVVHANDRELAACVRAAAAIAGDATLAETLDLPTVPIDPSTAPTAIARTLAGIF